MILIKKCVLIGWLISAHLTSFAISVDCNLEPRDIKGKLKKSILCKYDKTVHPTLNETVTIAIKMVLKAFTFDDQNNVLTLSSLLWMQWQDDNLKWTPAEFGSISVIEESSETIWQPNLHLYNSDIASVHSDTCKSTSCVIMSDGSVHCMPQCVHTARCSGDFKSWPFDTQNCSLHMGAWADAGDELDFIVNKTYIPIANLQSQNKLWRILKVSYTGHDGNYSSTRKTHPSVIFTFLLERHSAGHAAVLLVPAMIMASVNLISLWMSPEMSQRLMLLIFNILSHFIFMQQLSWYVPSNGDSCPYIVLCFRDSLITTGFLLINTIVVRGFTLCGLDVPNWMESATSFMGANRFGQTFLSKSYLIDRQPLHADYETSELNITESQTIPKKPLTNTWVLFAKFIDRLLFVIVLLVYVSMYILLMPKGNTFDVRTRGDIEIIKNNL